MTFKIINLGTQADVRKLLRLKRVVGPAEWKRRLKIMLRLARNRANAEIKRDNLQGTRDNPTTDG